MNSNRPSAGDDPEFWENSHSAAETTPKLQRKIPAHRVPLPKAGEEPVAESKPQEKKRPFVKFERRGDDGSKNFKRLAARTGADSAPPPTASSGPATGGPALSAPTHETSQVPFGRKKVYENAPDFAPNKAVDLLNQVYTLSPVRWIDQLNTGRLRNVAIGVVLAGIIVGMFVIYTVGSWQKVARTGSVTDVQDQQFQSQKAEAAREALKAFLQARTWQEKQKYVQFPDQIAAQMEAYYDGGGKDPGYEEIKAKSTSEADGKVVFGFFWTNPLTGNPAEIFVWETESGMKVDWEDFAGLGAMPWPAFCAGKPQEPQQMRVELEKAENYDGLYADSSKYQCYKLGHKNGGQTIYGYVVRSERWAQDILGRLDAQGRASLNLFLKFEPGAESGQVLIAGYKRAALK